MTTIMNMMNIDMIWPVYYILRLYDCSYYIGYVVLLVIILCLFWRLYSTSGTVTISPAWSLRKSWPVRLPSAPSSSTTRRDARRPGGFSPISSFTSTWSTSCSTPWCSWWWGCPSRCPSLATAEPWRRDIRHSHWSSSYIAALSLVESCRVLKYFHARKGPIIGVLSVATPAVLYHKEPAGRIQSP